VLSEEKGKRRIPIIVGGFEAQAIAIQLEGLKPPRPLTHDLFYNFATTFKISLVEVIIYKLEEGVFHSKLICDNGKGAIEIDTRTSDAIALALRFKCPIFTTEEILDKSGIILEFDEEKKSFTTEGRADKDFDISEEKVNEELADLENSDLKKLLEEAVKNENYEKASVIRDELNRRKKRK
jgi:bifunctional DNase/RNase